MEINFIFEEIKKFDFDKRIKSKIIEMCRLEKREIAYLNFIFCSDNYILKMNKKYLNHDYFTDVITFNYNEDKILNGDIFISKDTVLYNSEKFNVPFENELNRVMIHGVLHLIGYNDKNESEKTEMKSKENQYLGPT